MPVSHQAVKTSSLPGDHLDVYKDFVRKVRDYRDCVK